MKNVLAPKVVTTGEAIESPLPAEIQEALGELRSHVRPPRTTAGSRVPAG